MVSCTSSPKIKFLCQSIQKLQDEQTGPWTDGHTNSTKIITFQHTREAKIIFLKKYGPQQTYSREPGAGPFSYLPRLSGRLESMILRSDQSWNRNSSILHNHINNKNGFQSKAYRLLQEWPWTYNKLDLEMTLTLVPILIPYISYSK